MVKFLNDTIVQPLESQWFQFYKAKQDREILPLESSKVYTTVSKYCVILFYTHHQMMATYLFCQDVVIQSDTSENLQIVSVLGQYQMVDLSV